MTTETQTQTNNSAVDFTTATRVHVAINVSKVERSLPFYQVLFGQEATKVRPGYVKFEVAEPPLNFTLNENPALQKDVTGTISHFGIQVKSTDEVLKAKNRFIDSGLATFDEENVTCCYAVQDKVWVTDPDGNSWEVFVVLDADAPVHSTNQQGDAASCACNASEIVTDKQGRTIPLTAKNVSKCC